VALCEGRASHVGLRTYLHGGFRRGVEKRGGIVDTIALFMLSCFLHSEQTLMLSCLAQRGDAEGREQEPEQLHIELANLPVVSEYYIVTDHLWSARVPRGEGYWKDFAWQERRV